MATTVLKEEEVPLRLEEHVVKVRQIARQWAVAGGFSLIDQTKIVTAASELARNTVIYGGGGTVHLASLADGAKRGLRLVFADRGPGIADVAQAMKDGFTSGGGLGLGLGGSKRLMNEFHIETAPGQGTRITITKWK